jgi:hypothetical protein
VACIDPNHGSTLMVRFAMLGDLDSAYMAASHALDYYLPTGKIRYP